MEGPKFMITAKDRLYISDIMNHMLTLAKKNKVYLSVCDDTEVSDLLEDLNDIISEQYDTWLNVLGGNNE